MKFDHALVGPAGEVRYCPGHEHEDEAYTYLQEKGEYHGDAGYTLAKRGWLRVTSSGGFTDTAFCKPERLTQAQRDVLFDMAMDAREQNMPWIANSIVRRMEEIED